MILVSASSVYTSSVVLHRHEVTQRGQWQVTIDKEMAFDRTLSARKGAGVSILSSAQCIMPVSRDREESHVFVTSSFSIDLLPSLSADISSPRAIAAILAVAAAIAQWWVAFCKDDGGCGGGGGGGGGGGVEARRRETTSCYDHPPL